MRQPCYKIIIFKILIIDNRGGSNIGSSGIRSGYTGDRYIYGQCLFIGWATMIIDLAAGAVLFTGSCHTNDVSDYTTGRTAPSFSGMNVRKSIEDFQTKQFYDQAGVAHQGNGGISQFV